MPKKATTKKSQEPDYEQLGRQMARVFELGYTDKRRMLKMSFLKGMASGLGGVIGATLVVALVLWILSLLNFIPFIEPIQDTLQESTRP